MTRHTIPCDRCGLNRGLSELKVRTATGRARLALCVDCVAYYRERHQVVGANLSPIGAQTAPLLRPDLNARPILMPRIPGPARPVENKQE